jgi:hypothetical protein
MLQMKSQIVILKYFLTMFVGGTFTIIPGESPPFDIFHTLGMRGGKEQRDLKLGDIIIGKDSSGEEFIQHVRERQTKTRTGEDPNN